jgi:hypothetical protein
MTSSETLFPVHSSRETRAVKAYHANPFSRSPEPQLRPRAALSTSVAAAAIAAVYTINNTDFMTYDPSYIAQRASYQAQPNIKRETTNSAV